MNHIDPARPKDFMVRQMDEDHHRHDHFNEQIALLYPLEINEEKREVTLIRSFVYVCQPGCASLDPDHPGLDTFEAWEEMDAFIDNQGVCGFFHTHPPHCFYWSNLDIRTQNGLAKANGRKYLWHGVQAASTGPMEGVPDTGVAAIGVHGSEFTCCWMEHGRVFRYNYGMIEDDLSSPIIRIKMPPIIEWHNNAYTICL